LNIVIICSKRWFFAELQTQLGQQREVSLLRQHVVLVLDYLLIWM
jgi:hypothetical protein